MISPPCINLSLYTFRVLNMLCELMDCFSFQIYFTCIKILQYEICWQLETRKHIFTDEIVNIEKYLFLNPISR